MEAQMIGLVAIFFLIAFFYSMVGFGGGSSYLAVLAAAGFSHTQIPPVALACNLIVAGGGFLYFYRAGHFDFKKVIPFVIFSIPMAYWGGKIQIGKSLFCILLGASLLAAAIRLFIPDRAFESAHETSARKMWMLGLPIGALLGFLSGLVGIGGGIFLSPLLLFLRWANIKEAAAAASFFIVVNSFSGLLGQIQKGGSMDSSFWMLGIAVLLGGQIGSRLGSIHLPKMILQRVLAVLVAIVAIKMMVGAA